MFVLLLCLVAVASADNWAVLICGSRGYGNYRHHADVCHAFKTLTTRGIPAENIITFLYDDVAQDPENPFPGQLFNIPSSGPGVDVYKGCQKDYTGMLTTGENLVNVLKGDAQAMKGKGSGRVLNSTKDDYVFLNFVDHGGPGIIAMGAGDLMHADTLIKTLQYMHSNNMYKQLVFYMEACESGSMFESLPTDIDIYATTAANADESSWGTYCPPQDVVDGKSINSCLGDLYSVNWMQDSDKPSSFSESLEQQYNIVKQETNKSHVTQFGDMKISTEPINKFQGGKKVRSPVFDDETPTPAVHVDSRLATTHSLFHRYISASGDRKQVLGEELMAEIAHQLKFETVFKSIRREFFEFEQFASENMKITQWDCYRAANKAVQDFCGGYSDYTLKYARVVANMCEVTFGDSTTVVANIQKRC